MYELGQVIPLYIYIFKSEEFNHYNYFDIQNEIYIIKIMVNIILEAEHGQSETSYRC